MPNLFIWGGCVARDTYGKMGQGWALSEYVARQSWISAAHGPADVVGVVDLASPFQQKCLERDIAGSALQIFTEKSEASDVVVLDLLAERSGVLRAPGGGYLTQSWELEQSKLLNQQPAPLESIDFGTDAHFDLWTNAASKVLSTIKESGRPYLILAPMWAKETASGESSPKLTTYRGRTVDWFNGTFERYYRWLADQGHPLVRLDEHAARADENHQWGLAPFHYAEDVYQRFDHAIKAASAA